MWNIDFELLTAVLLVIVLIYFLSGKRMVNYQSNIYMVLLILSLSNTAIRIAMDLMFQYRMRLPLVLLDGISTLYFASKSYVFYLLFYYINLVTINQFAKKFVLKSVYAIPLIIAGGMLVANAFWPLVLNSTYDQGLVFYQGRIVLDVVWMIYLLLSLAQVYHYRNRLSDQQRLAILITLLFVIGAIIMQNLAPKYLLTDLALGVGMLLFYFVIENPKLTMDELTGLFNRSAFLERMDADIKRKVPFYVITMAMDDFKFINETFGYYYGDLLLKAIGSKLKTAAKFSYRYMSDMFSIVVYDESQVMPIINRIKSKLDEPWNINSTVCLLSASFSVVSYPANADSSNELNDFIVYTVQEAKRGSKGGISFGENSAKARIKRNNTIEYLLKEAIKFDRFEVYYQPIYSVREQRYIAAEALVRLRDEELGFISPAEFIPIAEKNGTILKIGQIVFEKVCSFIQEYQIEKLGLKYIEVNLSVVQCMQRRLAPELIAIMKQHQVDPKLINFELTETSVAESKGMLETTMNELISYGCRFSLDDFGTGYSNISYVTQLPFNIVKIDRGFVWASQTSTKVNTAIAHLISMFRKMDMAIVAEGVESKEQLDMLVEMDCDYIQGYYYSKPIRSDELIRLVSNIPA